MKKTCVFIIGTNGVGKTSLAKRLINGFGGISDYHEKITYCKDARACFVGKYEGVKFGGVDGFNNVTHLAERVNDGLKKCDFVFCEGKYIKNFSMNVLNAMFQAERQIVVFLYAPVAVLDERLRKRGGRGITQCVWRDQKVIARNAKRWQEIGATLLQYDTSEFSLEFMESDIRRKLSGLCG